MRGLSGETVSCSIALEEYLFDRVSDFLEVGVVPRLLVFVSRDRSDLTSCSAAISEFPLDKLGDRVVSFKVAGFDKLSPRWDLSIRQENRIAHRAKRKLDFVNKKDHAMTKGYMYILLCADRSYYVGSTTELDLRVRQHQLGEGANYTRERLPVKLVYYEEYDRIDDAFNREKQVQRWSRKKKEALIRGEFEKLKDLSRNYTQFRDFGRRWS